MPSYTSSEESSIILEFVSGALISAGTMTKYDLKNSEHKDIIPMRVARFYHSATVTREINSEGIWRSKIVIVGG